MRRARRLCLLLVIAGIASGYRMIKPDVHESMTRAAKKCFDRAMRTTSKPDVCQHNLNVRNVDMTWIRGSSLRAWHIAGWFRHLTGIERDYPTLDHAVRWPDDPTRQIYGIAMWRWALNAGPLRCRIHERAGVIDIDSGLLCNSHFGDMQFLHAQATHAGEAAADTHYRIMAWAELLYRIASGELTDAQLDAPYCEHFADRKNIFHLAMLSSPLATPCETDRDPAWTLTTLFTMRCSGPVTSRRCKEERQHSRHDRTRIYATGALLHLIQDSYAQGHCVRGECEFAAGDVVAKVECLPISMFTTYRVQDSSRHTEADMRPVFAASCAWPSQFDDPVTASAKALWHIRQRSGFTALRDDLYRVFGRPETMAHVAPAGAGRCFTRRAE